MKNNYFDETNIDEGRKKRRAGKKRRVLKGILTALAILVLALAAFIITVKLLQPDYDFSSLVPERAVSFVREDILGKTTTEATTTAPAAETTQPTTEKMMNYLDFDAFDFDTAKQGNFLGNLLNGGKVGTDFTYLYHIVDGEGIYRFAPSSESYTRIYKTADTLSSLNLRGDYLYFVNENDGKLYKLQKGSSKPKAVAENVRLAYVYNQLVYFITRDNRLCVMNAKALTPVTVYYTAEGDSELQLIGIAKERVFFSVTESDGTIQFLTIDNFAKSPAVHFRENDNQAQSGYYMMENGFLYFYRKDAAADTYTLYRQKFGSQKEVALVKETDALGYPIADANRLYYAALSNNRLKMTELNMNSGKTKTLLTAKVKDGAQPPSLHHGGAYDFIIGGGAYRASCIDTSSTNVMTFKNGKWSY